ncbi:VanZ family protein [Taibaiella lutea]|uniref:VanZ family protein n=1 Tax=Taibaiella lutea TaxID=2608001 RepID=A0A5M6CJ07_9BACT|nr:VanZ family protein [Taibaiella lutea]KAA5534440.1 VanZ family protein [Taibaiella lutea]
MKMLFNFFTKNKTRAKIIAVLWTLMIFVACLIPGRDVPSVHFPLIDKWVHFVIFGGFSFLWLAVFQTTNIRKRVLLFLLAVLTGYLVELLQGSGITSGRSYDLWDVLADSIGGALGVGLFYLTERKYGRESMVE